MLYAVGNTERIGMVTDLAPNETRVGLTVGILQRPVQMVRPENRFVVEPIPSDRFRENRNWKALVILTDLRDPSDELEGSISDLISRREREEMAARPADYRIIENAWAKGQAVLLLHAGSPEGLTAFLRERGETMVERFDVALQEAIGPLLEATGSDSEMEKYVAQNYGFEIVIPRGYSTGEDREGRVVRIYRVVEGEPARFVLVHWMPAAEAPSSPEALLELRDRLGRIYYDGDYVLKERSGAEAGSLDGEPATLLQGIWQNDKYVIGGPFRSFGFRRGDRYFLIDVSVFNPPGAKLPYLREVLAIARTFQTVDPA